MMLATALRGAGHAGRTVLEIARILRSASRVAGAFEAHVSPQASDLRTLGIEAGSLPKA